MDTDQMLVYVSSSSFGVHHPVANTLQDEPTNDGTNSDTYPPLPDYMPGVSQPLAHNEVGYSLTGGSAATSNP